MTVSAKEVHVCDDWLTCELANREDIVDAAESLRETQKWSEVVPGIQSIAVQFDPVTMSAEQAASLFLEQLHSARTASRQDRASVEIPICYDPEFAPDIQRVAAQTGQSLDAFIRWHQDTQFAVTMLGFLPGFAYLQCDQNLGDVRRLDQPRQHVPAGSIGMIGDQNCLYPFDSPGGWPIIGRTPVQLFAPANNPPNLLHPGQAVIFRQIDRHQYERLIAERDT